MSRSYVTVRALVLIVTLLVIIEYFSLMQSAENADKKAPIVFRILEDGDSRHDGGRYSRHVLQALDSSLYSYTSSKQQHSLVTDKVTLVTRQGPSSNAANSTDQCPLIPPSLHGRFPVTLTDIPDMDTMAR